MAQKNSRKGFKKLQTLEMVELNESGMFLENSDSETDLLDLTDTTKVGRLEKYPNSYSCSSYWQCCAVLYVGLLTVIVILLGVFSGYVLTTTWQVSSSVDTSHISIQKDMQDLKQELETHDERIYFILNDVREMMFALNKSIVRLNVSTLTKLRAMDGRLTEVELMIGAMEEKSQTAFIKEVQGIHKEVAVLDMDIQLLNSSLEEFQQMRRQMTSFVSILDHYDSRLLTLSRTIGDTMYNNTNIQDSIQGFGDRLLKFKNRIGDVENQVSTEHNKMQQSSDLLSAQLLHLQSVVVDLNATLLEEVGQMWVNMNATKGALDSLSAEVMALAAVSPDTVSSTEKHLISEEPATPTSLPHTSTSSTPHTSTLPLHHTTSSTPHTSTLPLHITTSAPHTPHSAINQNEDNKFLTMPDVWTNSHSTSPQSDSVSFTSSQPDSSTGQPATQQTMGWNDTNEDFTTSQAILPDEDSVGTQEVVGTEKYPVADGDPQTNESSSIISGGTPAAIDETNGAIIKQNGVIAVLKKIMDIAGDIVLDYDKFATFLPSKEIFDKLDLNNDNHVDHAELQSTIHKLQVVSTMDVIATPSLVTPVQETTEEEK